MQDDPFEYQEASRWLPALRTVRFHAVSNERQRVKDAFRTSDKPFDILITTYETFVAEESWFKTRRWNYCVLDEGQFLTGLLLPSSNVTWINLLIPRPQDQKLDNECLTQNSRFRKYVSTNPHRHPGPK